MVDSTKIASGKCLSAATVVALALLSTSAQACPTYHTLTNGTTADASQVMDNFNSILQCPTFTGDVLATTFRNLAGDALIYYGGSNDINVGSGNTSQFVRLYSGGSERFRITTSGNTGLGTTSPGTTLDVVKANQNLSDGANGDAEAHIAAMTSDSAAVDVGGAIGMGGFYAGTSTRQMFGAIAGRKSNATSGDARGYLGFLVNNNTSLVEKMRLDASGNLGIGTTSPAVALQVVGDARVGTSGSNGCVQGFGGTALTGTCTSDVRLKTVTGKVSNVLSRLASLNLVNFRWNATAADLYRKSTTTINTGFLAQSVEMVFPELVSIDAHGYEQLNYTNLQLYGLAAIKELKETDDNQTTEIERLHNENRALKAQLVELTSRVRSEDSRLSALESKSGIHIAANDNIFVRFAHVVGLYSQSR